MDIMSLHFRWYHLLMAAIFVTTHLSSVASLPWKSPPKWKLPPLPDRRTSSDGGVGQGEELLREDLLSRVRHLERVVQRRLDDIKLAKVRAMEESIQQELAEREQASEDAGHQGQEPGHQGQQEHKGAGVTQSEGVLEKEMLQHEEPHKAARNGHKAAPSNLQDQYDPMPKLKQISRDLVDLIEEIDRHTQ